MKRALAFAVCVACQSAPPTTLPPPTSASPPPASSDPITAEFRDLTSSATFTEAQCETHIIAIVSGRVDTFGEALGIGDFMLARSNPTFELKTSSPTRIAVVRHSGAPCILTTPESPSHTIVRASKAPELTWAGGAMHAQLDGDGVSPFVYFGRLRGSAPVAEHVHESSIEVLCAIEASGTFTLKGVAQRLGAGTCVTVPQNTKHSWTPDPSSSLKAVQLYFPPGPEQRFKALASPDGGK